jgi:DNA-binding LacI/PurR family transcriptional regulator
MKKPIVTQKHIARTAGVSQTTVSLILNNADDSGISEETRERVMQVVDQMGYVPQTAARTLVRGYSPNLGLVLIQPHYQVFRDPFIPNIITGLGVVARQAGFRLLVEHINDLDELNTITNMLKGGEVAGLVLSNFQLAEHVVLPLIAEGYPIVTLDRTNHQWSYSASIDHASGVRAAMRHLLGLGHQRIAVITYTTLRDPQVVLRLDVIRTMLREAGCPLDDNLLRYGGYDPESGYRAMRDLLQQRPLPSAVFGMNDMMALGAMRAIHEAGLRIPQDIAVVGYDDMRFAEFLSPPLTTVHAPEVEYGETIGRLLLDILEKKAPEKADIVLQTKLVVRDSCGAK